AGIERDVKRFRRRQATDFNEHFHGAERSAGLKTIKYIRSITTHHHTGGLSRSRGGAVCSRGTMLGSAALSTRASSLARNSAASRSNRRAILRHRPCPSLTARPPTITPATSAPITITNSGRVSEAAGALGLNGSNDSVM